MVDPPSLLDQPTPDAQAGAATRVHKLAIPRHVTMHAERRENAFGPGHHYAVTGFYPRGEEAFTEQVVPDSQAEDASEAIRVQLGRFRERGW